MSWNRSRYDSCQYNKDLSQSTGPLNYNLDPNKFYSCNDGRVEFGLLGGNNVSLTKHNMVELESDLFGINRQLSNCPERQYAPNCQGCSAEANDSGIPCDNVNCQRNKDLNHLNPVKIINYRPRINHVGYDLKYPGCPVNGIKSINGQDMKYPPQRNPVSWSGETGAPLR